MATEYAACPSPFMPLNTPRTCTSSSSTPKMSPMPIHEDIEVVLFTDSVGNSPIEPRVGRRSKMTRGLSVSADDLQVISRNALIASQALDDTSRNLSLSAGDNEEGAIYDVDNAVRIQLNKLSLIPVPIKHSFSIDPKELDALNQRSYSCCQSKGFLPNQKSFEDPITGEKMTPEIYQTIVVDDKTRLNSYEDEWSLDKTS